MAGVVGYVDANDIPGTNTWKYRDTAEEIFCSGKSQYAGQSIGLVVAETREIAIEAARMVEIMYGNEGTVVCDMEKAMETAANVIPFGDPVEYGEVNSLMESAEKVVQGRFKMGSQYHFHMETHICIVTPTEDGFNVEISSQDIDQNQNLVANALNIPVNRLAFKCFLNNDF